MAEPFGDPVCRQIVDFLLSIGIRVVATEVTGPTILPGIRISGGTLLVDEARLEWPGDLLHEAAHIALTAAGQRSALNDDTGGDGGQEIGSLAWSWAAVCHLGIDPEIVFHSGGYRGGSQAIIENFRGGHYIGVPFLRWTGLASSNYPRMVKWLRD